MHDHTNKHVDLRSTAKMDFSMDCIMRTNFARFFFLLVFFVFAGNGLLLFCVAQETAPGTPAEASRNMPAEKYVFRYKFHVGDVMKWNVVQQVNMLTSLSSDQVKTETYSSSTKVWKVLSVDENGTAVLEYSVEDADLWNKSSDSKLEKRFNSKSDEKPFPDFIDVARSLNKPLAHFTINAKGEVLKKVQKSEYAATTEENKITIPMPEHSVAVGESWDFPEVITLPQPDGTVKKISTRQKYTLQKIENGIATIDFKTDVTTPLHNDRESQLALITKIKNGVIHFDVISGCSIWQQFDIASNVIGGLTAGPQVANSISYKSRFTEKYLRDDPGAEMEKMPSASIE